MSLKQVKKETLTDDFIKQDVLYQFKNDNHIAVNIILCAVSILFIFFFSLLSPYFWIALVIPVFFLLLSYIKRHLKTEKIKNGEYSVITDKLLYEKQGELRTEPSFYKGKWISYLQFENCGRWELEGMYYTWSNTYKMSGSGICNTSLQGDTFYLVIDKQNNKIILGYNTRFFDYKKE